MSKEIQEDKCLVIVAQKKCKCDMCKTRRNLEALATVMNIQNEILKAYYKDKEQLKQND